MKLFRVLSVPANKFSVFLRYTDYQMGQSTRPYVPIATYAMHEIEHGNGIQLPFEWLQSQNFITTETSCDGISPGEYYLAWIGRSDNTHPIIRSVKVKEYK